MTTLAGHFTSPVLTFFKKSVSLFLLLYFPFFLSAQNLIPNSGFESFGTCPVGFSQFSGYVSNWGNPSNGTPDYMNVCANPNPAGVPANGTGFQMPHSGNGYAGIYSGNDIYHEYIQIHLTAPLTIGNTYTFKMYVTLHNKSKTATDDLGAYFSVAAPTSASSGFLSGSPVPQIYNTPGVIIKDTINWVLISGNYTATAAMQYVTIGHFKSDAVSTFQQVNYGSQGAYYYIDDVSLVPAVPLPVEWISFNGVCQTNHEVDLNWTTASEQNNCCFDVQRSSDGMEFNSVGHLTGSGSTSMMNNYTFTDKQPATGINYYRLKQTDFNGDLQYSKIIAVRNNDEKISFQFISDKDHNLFSIRIAGKIKSTVQIINLLGSKIFEQECCDESESMVADCSSLKKGFYIIRICAEDEMIFSKKFCRY